MFPSDTCTRITCVCVYVFMSDMSPCSIRIFYVVLPTLAYGADALHALSPVTAPGVFDDHDDDDDTIDAYR